MKQKRVATAVATFLICLSFLFGCKQSERMNPKTIILGKQNIVCRDFIEFDTSVISAEKFGEGELLAKKAVFSSQEPINGSQFSIAVFMYGGDDWFRKENDDLPWYVEHNYPPRELYKFPSNKTKGVSFCLTKDSICLFVDSQMTRVSEWAKTNSALRFDRGNDHYGKKWVSEYNYDEATVSLNKSTVIAFMRKGVADSLLRKLDKWQKKLSK